MTVSWTGAERRAAVASKIGSRVERSLTPQWVLTVVVLLFGWFFIGHLGLRHERFGTFDYDLGIWDRQCWCMPPQGPLRP
jgi:hypothetical protein